MIAKKVVRALAAVVLLAPFSGVAAADPMPALPAAQTVSDQMLSQIRGKYVPPAQSARVDPASVLGLQRNTLSLLQQMPGAARTAAASPLSNVTPAGGTVTYFGVEMVSSWTQNDQNGSQGVSAGLELGFDLEHHSVTIEKWSSSSNGGLSTQPSSGTITGSAVGNLSGGVAQNIQAAGDGNTISNAASVTVNGSDSAVLVPTTNTCTQQCTISIGPGGAQIAIATPNGSVLQSIGPNGIVQSAQVSSSMNTIKNQLGVNVRVSQTPSFNASSLLPVLQTLTVLP
jgi:hypothetical protein